MIFNIVSEKIDVSKLHNLVCHLPSLSLAMDILHTPLFALKPLCMHIQSAHNRVVFSHQTENTFLAALAVSTCGMNVQPTSNTMFKTQLQLLFPTTSFTFLHFTEQNTFSTTLYRELPFKHHTLPALKLNLV